MKKIIFSLSAIAVTTFTLSQNVGIGTTTPQRLLHLSGNSELLRIQGGQPWIGFMNNTDPDYRGFIFYPDTSLVFGSAAGTNMPLIIAPNNIGLLHATSSQRIGIGTSAPSQKLDVNGNMNVSGNISVNNLAGQPNQVLMTNSAGNTVWGNLSDYKKVAHFNQVSASPIIWTVPTGVTKVRIEACGGGGGGAYGGGGAGGTYILSGEIEVMPGNTISVNIGDGGAGAVSNVANGSNGENSTVIINTSPVSTFEAAGGNGGFVNKGGYPIYYGYSGLNLIQLPGQSGSSSTITYAERISGQFVQITNHGDGGGVGPLYSYNGPGGTSVVEIATNIALAETYPAFVRYGCGGGGSKLINANGGSGFVNIYY